MGLISMAKNSVTGIVKDQVKEFFYADTLPEDILMVKGKKRMKNGATNAGADNIISKGSAIVVNEGQCMLIVQQGEVVEVCAEPGEFIFDSSTEPSIFYGSLGDNVKETFQNAVRRFTFGGMDAKDQRVYFVNIKEINGNLFGTPSPIPFRIVDEKVSLDLEVSVKFNGQYKLKIIDPLLFYKNVAGNVTESFTRTTGSLFGALKTELLDAMGPALSEIAGKGILPSQLQTHKAEIVASVKNELLIKWQQARGLEVMDISFNNIILDEADTKILKDLQHMKAKIASGTLQGSLAEGQVEAMKMAASNESGAMTGFLGMGMTNMFGGQMQQQQMYQQPMQQQPMQQQPVQQQPVQQQPVQQAVAQAAPVLGWACSCGATDNNGKFCMACGAKKPDAAGWTCSCAHVNQGQFCSECGAKKPAGASLYKCDKCGWEPEDPAKPPKFCPECGDVFDGNDIV